MIIQFKKKRISIACIANTILLNVSILSLKNIRTANKLKEIYNTFYDIFIIYYYYFL